MWNTNFLARIDKSTVNFVLNNKHKELQFDKILLVSDTEEMINTVSAILKEKNFKDSIKFELFSTSTSENKIEKSLERSHSKITVVAVDSDETSFEMSQKQTILEAALKQGIDAPYSCQGGICSSCLAYYLWNCRND